MPALSAFPRPLLRPACSLRNPKTLGCVSHNENQAFHVYFSSSDLCCPHLMSPVGITPLLLLLVHLPWYQLLFTLLPFCFLFLFWLHIPSTIPIPLSYSFFSWPFSWCWFLSLLFFVSFSSINSSDSIFFFSFFFMSLLFFGWSSYPFSFLSFCLSCSITDVGPLSLSLFLPCWQLSLSRRQGCKIIVIITSLMHSLSSEISQQQSFDSTTSCT